MKKKAVKKEVNTKVAEKVEYFTDDMHKEIFTFPDAYKGSGKPITKAVSFATFSKK